MPDRIHACRHCAYAIISCRSLFLFGIIMAAVLLKDRSVTAVKKGIDNKSAANKLRYGNLLDFISRIIPMDRRCNMISQLVTLLSSV
jgi:hypothetical protein